MPPKKVSTTKEAPKLKQDEKQFYFVRGNEESTALEIVVLSELPKGKDIQTGEVYTHILTSQKQEVFEKSEETEKLKQADIDNYLPLGDDFSHQDQTISVKQGLLEAANQKFVTKKEDSQSKGQTQKSKNESQTEEDGNDDKQEDYEAGDDEDDDDDKPKNKQRVAIEINIKPSQKSKATGGAQQKVVEQQISEDSQEDNDQDAGSKQKPAVKKGQSVKGGQNLKAISETEDDEDQEADEESQPKKGAKKTKQSVTDQSGDDDAPQKKRAGRPASKKGAAQQDDGSESEGEKQSGPTRATRGRQNKPIIESEASGAEKDSEMDGASEQDEDSENEGGKGQKGRKSKSAGGAKQSTEKKGKKEKGSKEKPSKFKKGKWNPDIKLVEKCNQREGADKNIREQCCVRCTNKEILRAIQVRNYALLEKLVHSENQVSTFFEKWSSDTDLTPIELIFLNKDEQALKIFFEYILKKGDRPPKLAPEPICSLKQISTGHNDRWAYGVATRKVNVSRGGKEGNNAFVSDLNNVVGNNDWQESDSIFETLLENETDVKLFEYLRTIKELSIENKLFERIYIAVRAGNQETAGYLVALANQIGGYGYNQVHEDVLLEKKPEVLNDVKKVSIAKKNQGTYGRGGFQGVFTPIHAAAINPNPEFLQKLIEPTGEFNIQDDIMRKPIHYAAACKGPGPLEYLIKNNVDTREGDRKKMTPMMIAAKCGRVKNIELLLSANNMSNIDAQTREGWRAIHYAAFNGHLDCLKILIEKGKLDVNQPGPGRMTPLILAASKGHEAIVRYLVVEKDAKVIPKDKTKRSALCLAIKNGHVKIASLLLQHGALFNEADSSGNTPLHYASAYGFYECIDLLVSAGADLNVNNTWNLAPISVAMAQGHFGIVRQLLDYPGTDINCQDVDGRTLISKALEDLSPRTLSHIEYLVEEKKADPNIPDTSGQTPLHYLAAYNSQTYIQKQMRYVPHDAKNSTELIRKFQEECLTLVKSAIEILLKNNANPNAQTINDLTVWQITLNNSNIEILKFLISQIEIDFSIINAADRSFLHYLARPVAVKGAEVIDFVYEVLKYVDSMSDKYKMNLKEHLNQVDVFGFTPILLFFQEFLSPSGLGSHFYAFNSKLQLEEKERRAKDQQAPIFSVPEVTGLMIDEKILKPSPSQPQQQAATFTQSSDDDSDEDDEQTFSKAPRKKLTLRGGARMVQTFQKYPKPLAVKAARASMPAFMFSNNDANVNEQNLDTQTLNEILLKARDETLALEAKFLELIEFFVSKGGDINAHVIEYKQLRGLGDKQNKMEEEKPDEEEANNGDFNAGASVEKKKVYPFCQYGNWTVLHFTMRYPSRSIIDRLHSWKLDIKALDHKNRSAIQHFIQYNAEDNLYPGINSSGHPKEYLNSSKVETLNYLINNMYDVLNKDKRENTAVIQAVQSAKYTFATILVEKGQAKLNDMNRAGKVPLITVLHLRNLETIEKFLKLGSDPNFPDQEKRTALHHAVNNADKGADASFELEALLLRYKADINAIDAKGRTPLHYSFISINDQYDAPNTVRIDPFETVSSLVSYPGCKFQVQDKYGRTPLHYGAQRAASISAIYMIKKGAQIDIEDNEKNTPLCIAFKHAHSEFTTVFIQNKADTSRMIHIQTAEERKRKKGKITPEEEAKNQQITKRPTHNVNNGYGFRTNIPYYLNYLNNNRNNFGGADEGKKILDTMSVDSDENNPEENYDGPQKKQMASRAAQPFNPFGFGGFNMYNQPQSTSAGSQLTEGEHSFFKAAVRFGWQGISYLLLMESSYTLINALEDALTEKKFQLVYTLMMKFPGDESVSKTNKLGQNLLHIFAQHGGVCPESLADQIIAEFERRNIDINALDSHQRSALHYAAESGYIRLCNWLLEKKLDPNAYDNENYTPFALCIKRNRHMLLVLEKFIIFGGKLSIKYPCEINDEQQLLTPFLYLIATRMKDQKVLQWYLDHGSDINEIEQETGHDALYFAILNNSKNLAKFIINQKGFDKQRVDKNGRGPLHHAVRPLEYGTYENLDMIQLLVKSGFQINLKDKSNTSPIEYAAALFSENTITKLIELGADEALYKQQAGSLKRVNTSIVVTANWPEEEVQYEPDAKAFIEETLEQMRKDRNIADGGSGQSEKAEIDPYFDRQYNRKWLEVVTDEKDEPYSLLMTKVDIQFGGYSKYVYYKMQLVYDRNSRVYINFTRYGRIGEPGQFQHTPFPSKEEGVKEFSKIFSQKAGNEWSLRHSFVKQPKKYQLLRFAAQDNTQKVTLKPIDLEDKSLKNSNLDDEIFNFITQISDAKILQNTYNAYQIDEEIIPITRLSREFLSEAQNILDDIAEIFKELKSLTPRINEGGDILDQILKRQEEVSLKSSRFYELVPMKNAQNEPIQPIQEYNLRNEKNLLDNLVDIEAAAKILMASIYNKRSIHPMDYTFNALNVRMKYIDNSHPEHKLISMYIKKSQPCKEGFIKNIFAIERRGEAERMKAYAKDRRMILWHASKVANYIGILHFGLRVSGIGAQLTGNTLGDGIYFADKFSKSWPYSQDHFNSESDRFVLLCEVAVGEMKELRQWPENGVDPTKILKPNFKSLRAVGNTGPNLNKSIVLPNGANVPCGEVINYTEKYRKNKLKNVGGLVAGPVAAPTLPTNFMMGTAPQWQTMPMGGLSLAGSFGVSQAKDQSDQDIIDEDDDGNDDDENENGDSEEIAEMVEENQDVVPLQEQDEDDGENEDDMGDDFDEEIKYPKQAMKTPALPVPGYGGKGLFLPGFPTFAASQKLQKAQVLDQMERPTAWSDSEYVVYDASQVRIRYIVQLDPTKEN